MMMTTFSRVLTCEKTSTNNALIPSEDQVALRKSSSKILKAFLFPYNTSTSTIKQVRNIMRMNLNSSVEQGKSSTDDDKMRAVKADKISHKEVLQTKNIQKITRNDLINGTYDLDAKPVRGRTTDSSGRHHRSSNRPHKSSNRSRSKRSSTRSSSTSQDSTDSKTTTQVADIDDDYLEENEMFISAHDQLQKRGKRVSESDVSKYYYQTNDGTLTLPVYRTWTLEESDVSDYHSSA